MNPRVANRQYPLPAADCVVVFGRGIEMLPTENSDSPKVWVPVRTLQRVPLRGSGKNRSVIREDIDPSDPEGFIAQCEANVQAFIAWLKEMRDLGKLPKLAIISAGRPKYLQDAIKAGQAPEGYSEAAVMKVIVERELGDLSKLGVELLCITENMNTEDDVMKSVAAARERKLQSVVIINTLTAMARTEAFYRGNVAAEKEAEEARTAHLNPGDVVPDPMLPIDVTFVASEHVLMRGMEPDAAKAYEKSIFDLFDSVAGQRSLSGEMFGTIRAMCQNYDRANRGQY